MKRLFERALRSKVALRMAVLFVGCAVVPLIGLTLLTRTAGIALVAAFSLYLLWQRPQRWAPALALAWLPLLERFTHRVGVYGGELQGVFAQGLQGALGRIALRAGLPVGA